MSSDFAERLKQRAHGLKRRVYALYWAGRDPRTPWFAKAVAICTVAYALSPVDLIPDFIPVLGYFDDLIIVPAGIALAIRLVPREVWRECCNRAEQPVSKRAGITAAVAIVIMWAAIALTLIKWIVQLMRK
jgi:uncharacterized membrane protein YkvA (DUF1232 family)